jgi:alpha-galactosidase
MDNHLIDLSTTAMRLAFSAAGRFNLHTLSVGSVDWLDAGAGSAFFSVCLDGRFYGAHNLDYEGMRESTQPSGVRSVIFSFCGPGFGVEQHLKLYPEGALVELWPVVVNRGDVPITLERTDSFSLDLAPAAYRLLYYSGNWGAEFEPVESNLAEAVTIQSRSGRSTQGDHPWLALFRGDQAVLSAAVAWSGNWILRAEPLAGGLRLGGGLNDWSFKKTLAPGEAFESPPCVLALGRDLNEVSQRYARVGRAHWYPRNSLSARQPVEWNHWWPYEDVDINEEVFLANVERSAAMGMEVCTLDAGWFGPSDAGTHWYDYRGDWHLVNTRRFPAGIRRLSDAVHARGMKFGIWCEIEALGVKAALAQEHPEFVAVREGERLGYVCLGNPQAQEWAYRTLAHLIEDYRADWIKLDFNLNPGAGCDRADHGHQPGDGLYEHYRGYYRLLERVRRDYPEVVLENCSSGGLRIDLGMLRRTDMTFLSDPDWPVHDLQIFWGASTMLAPDVLLHWSFCEWRNENPPPQQNFNPRDPDLTQAQLDYYTRISMLGVYGLSQKLPDLPQWVAGRLAYHTHVYIDHVRRFVRTADLYRLTAQPRRDGQGERWVAFQYSLVDKSQHLLFVFRLPGGEEQRAVRLLDLDMERVYMIEGFDGEPGRNLSGRELIERGILFNHLAEEESALLRIS